MTAKQLLNMFYRGILTKREALERAANEEDEATIALVLQDWNMDDWE